MKLDDNRLTLPPQQVTLDVLLEKYAKGAERNVEAPEMARAVRRARRGSPRSKTGAGALGAGVHTLGGRINCAAGTRLAT